MTFSDPQFIYIVLVLPTLFALTFIAEGVHKLVKEEPPWVPFSLGFGFLFLIILTYLFVIR